MANVTAAEIDATFNKAEQLREAGKVQEALAEYSKVVYFAPRHWIALFYLGTLFGESGKNELAIALLKRAESIKPDNPVIKNHLADFLKKTRRIDEALASAKASWELDSTENNIAALYKTAQMLRESNRSAEAFEAFDQVINQISGKTKGKEDLEHILIWSRWFRSLCNLALDKYQEAWPDYEIRNDIPGVILPELKGELWAGQPLEGKTIFFAYEQRFGDIIQFIRFVPLIAEQGARILIQLPEELIRQVKFSYPGVEVVSTKEAIPEYDYYHYLTSIPAVYNLDKEACVKEAGSYFGINEADKPENFPARFGTSLKVGFVWQGKPDPDRSIPLQKYIPLLKHEKVSFYSFQLGEKSGELHENAVSWLVHDLSPNIKDFYDSSVMLKEMDLLITIDTAIAHQAGALGVPVWLMLKFFSDWRWELEREDNPWYPTMRIFRQDVEGDWALAGQQLEQAFDEWVALNTKSSES